MKRRQFLRNAGFCTAMLGVNWSGLGSELFAETTNFRYLGDNFIKPIDTKINLKPICSARVHKEAYNGPCRYQPLEELTPEAERNALHSKCDTFIDNLMTKTPSEAVLLNHDVVEYPEGDIIDPEYWRKLEPEVDDIDLFLSTYRVPGLERFKKPVAMVMEGMTNVDIAAYYRNLGLEGYAVYDWEDLNRLVALLKVRKAMSNTKVIVLTDRLDKVPYGVYSTTENFDHLKEKYGVETIPVSLKEFEEEFNKLQQDSKLKKQMMEMTESFIKDADAVYMKTDTIVNDFYFYATINNLFGKYNANSFSVRCFELCASKIPWNKKFVPCTCLSLMKDQGIAAGCEGDMNALLAMMLEMYLAKKAVYMGNPLFDKEKNVVRIYHDVPSLKMKGLSAPDLNYEIVNFADSGFGATVRYDFTQDIGQKVTLARFDPTGDKLLLSTGTIDGCFQMRMVGCKQGVSIELKDAMDMFYKSQDFGHHLAMVYGDYSDDIKRLGNIMNFDVVEC